MFGEYSWRFGKFTPGNNIIIRMYGDSATRWFYSMIEGGWRLGAKRKEEGDNYDGATNHRRKRKDLPCGPGEIFKPYIGLLSYSKKKNSLYPGPLDYINYFFLKFPPSFPNPSNTWKEIEYKSAKLKQNQQECNPRQATTLLVTD